MSTDTEWRWADPTGQQRLIRTDELRAALANGVIPPNAPVWRRGWRDWKPAHEVAELQSSALSAANGVVPNIPPPPLFVVAAQTQFEGKPAASGGSKEGDPPPPPRYVPAVVKAAPSTFSSSPPPAASQPPARAAISKKTITGIAPQGGVDPYKRPAGVPAPVPPSRDSQTEVDRRVPNIPVAREANTGVNLATLSQVQQAAQAAARENASVATVIGIPAIVEPRGDGRTPKAAAASPTPGTASTGTGTRPPPAAGKAPGATTGERRPVPDLRTKEAREKEMKRQTLILYGGAPQGGSEDPPASTTAPAATAPPIVVPGPPGKAPGKNAVTRPPPWGEGAVAIEPQIPRGGKAPRLGDDSTEDVSASMLLDVDLDDATVPAKPLTPSGRPPPIKPRSMPPPAPKAGASGSVRPPPIAPSPPKGSSAPPPAVAGAPGASSTNPGLGPPSTLAPARIAHDEGGILVGGAPAAATAVATAPTSGAADDPSDVRVDVDDAGPVDTFPWMEPVFARFPALKKVQRGKPKFFLPVIGGLAAFAVLVLFMILVKACFSSPSSDTTKQASEGEGQGEGAGAAAGANASASASGASSAESAGAAAGASAGLVAAGLSQAAAGAASTGAAAGAATAAGAGGEAAGAGAAHGACALGGAPKTIAPQAQVASGVEVSAGPAGLGVGFAVSAKEGALVVLAPGTLDVTTQKSLKSGDAIKRVTPIVSGKAPAAIVDTDKKSDHVGGRRVADGGAIDLGVADGSLAWAPHGTDKTVALWSLPGDAGAEALRATPFETGRGYAVTFRRSGAVWMGAFTGDGKTFKPAGDLAGTAGLGPQVGSPAIATSADRVLVMWADRASASDAWALRWQRWKPGESPEPAKVFVPPPGGLGPPHMSPSVAGLGGGRFLVVWTEGPVSGHEVRAETIDANGAPEGAPITVSQQGANAGQGQAAVGADGKGVIAYLEAAADGGKGFSVAATPIACTR